VLDNFLLGRLQYFTYIIGTLKILTRKFRRLLLTRTWNQLLFI